MRATVPLGERAGAQAVGRREESSCSPGIPCSAPGSAAQRDSPSARAFASSSPLPPSFLSALCYRPHTRPLQTEG